MAFGFLKRLFGSEGGGARTREAPPQQYNGYTIVASPRQEGGGWRVAGTISREVDGETRTHEFVRADTGPDPEGAVNLTLSKAKRLIDEQGDRLFG